VKIAGGLTGCTDAVSRGRVGRRCFTITAPTTTEAAIANTGIHFGKFADRAGWIDRWE
jgi:hypothetical protein